MILSYAMAVNSMAVAKVLQIIGIYKFFDEKIKFILILSSKACSAELSCIKKHAG